MKAAIEAMPWWDGSRSLRAYQRAERSFPWNWHYHPEIELTLITRGNGKRLVGDHSADYRAGDLVLLGSNLPHTWFTRKNGQNVRSNEAIVIQFRPGALPEQLMMLPEFTIMRALLDRSALGLRFVPADTALLETKMRSLVDARGLEAWLKLVSLLGELASCHREVLAGATYRNERSYKLGSRLGRIVGHIEDNYHTPMSLAQAASFSGLTPSSFARYFRRMTGKTFVEFRNACRIRKACTLLLESDLGVLEISLTCGFQNLANFNRQFRSFTGMPPRDYRKLGKPE
jgi:AraC-like DNA-binding protein